MGTCTRQISMLVVAALWLGVVIPAQAPAYGTLTMAVLVDNRVGVTPAQLTAAERIAGNIFRKIGVEVMWCRTLLPHPCSSCTSFRHPPSRTWAWAWKYWGWLFPARARSPSCTTA